MSDRCTSSRSSAARWLALASLLALAPLPAAAVVKVYDATPPHGTPGTHFGFSTTLCPPISSSPGQVQGQHVVSDTGSGTVTATTMDVVLHLRDGVLYFNDDGPTDVDKRARRAVVDWRR